jgi:hypothetical protein
MEADMFVPAHADASADVKELVRYLVGGMAGTFREME